LFLSERNASYLWKKAHKLIIFLQPQLLWHLQNLYSFLQTLLYPEKFLCGFNATLRFDVN